MNDKDIMEILEDIKKPSPKKCSKSKSGEHCYHESCLYGIEKNNCMHSTEGRNSKCDGIFDVCCECNDHKKGITPIIKLRQRAVEILGAQHWAHVADHRKDGVFHVYVRMYLESHHITKFQEHYEICNIIPSGKEDDKIIGKHSDLILLVKEKLK